MKKVTVVCVKEGSKYDFRYVNALFNMLNKTLSCDFEMVCFTENPLGISGFIETRPLPMPSSKGWWNKCLLFKPHLLTGYVLYLDLDMIILKDLVKYFEAHEELTLLANNFYLNGQPHTRINTSMMYWNANDSSFAAIFDTYFLNKEAYDSDAYLKWPTTADIGDQQVILDSQVKFRFFPSSGIRYFKFIKDDVALSPEVDLIVCKGKKQEDYLQHPLVQKFWATQIN
jgi:hypothetical protein